jgi:predicted nucleic acid-binding protein
MICVLDVSGGIEVILDRKRKKDIEQYLQNADHVISPDLYVAETANVYWKYVHFKQLNEATAEKALEYTLELVDLLEPSESLFRESFGLSCQMGIPVYDSLYLVLARRNNAVLLTLDTRLADACRTLSIKTAPL